MTVAYIWGVLTAHILATGLRAIGVMEHHPRELCKSDSLPRMILFPPRLAKGIVASCGIYLHTAKP